jgi:hypothetical protein
MVVPPYCRSRSGRVFRIQRRSEPLDDHGRRYTLRATPIRIGSVDGHEATRELDQEQVRDKIHNRQIVPSPEDIFEQLWQQLRLELDSLDDG